MNADPTHYVWRCRDCTVAAEQLGREYADLERHILELIEGDPDE